MIFYKTCADAGIQCTKDLKDDRGIMLTYDQFCAKYQVNIIFMQFFSEVSAIRRVWKYNRNVAQSLNQVHLIEKLCQSIQTSKFAYTMLIYQKAQGQNVLYTAHICYNILTFKYEKALTIRD